MNSARISAVATSPASQEENVGKGAFAIAMYCVLLVSYVLMAADRYLFPVLAVDVRRDFGFSLANTGLLSTIFTLGLGVGGLPTGYLLARFSRKAVLLTASRFFQRPRLLPPLPADSWACSSVWRRKASAWPCWRRPCSRWPQAISRATAPRPSAPSSSATASAASRPVRRHDPPDLPTAPGTLR